MEFWGKQFTALAVYYFCKKLDFKCLTGLYLRLCLYWCTNINICFLWDAFERHLNHIISLFKQDSQLISTIRLSRSGFLIANKFLKIFYCFQFSPGTRVYSNLCLLSSEALKIIRPLCWEVIHKNKIYIDSIQQRGLKNLNFLQIILHKINTSRNVTSITK